jgi:hypothetical protein
MRCNLATVARWLPISLLGLALSGCAWSNNDSVAYTGDRGIGPQPFPQNHRSEILALLKTYINDPRNIRDASIAEPFQKDVGGRQRYIVCLRYNARDNAGAYHGVKERFVLFVDGRLDRIVERPDDLCDGARYAPFPELEKLTR